MRILGRSGGKSALNSVAYGSCSQLTNELTGERTADYTQKKGLVCSFTLAPEHAPTWMYDPVKLASFIDTMERRKDSQLLREVDFSLPVELTPEQQQELAVEITQKAFVDRGMIGMVFLHDEGTGNPHAHIFLTMRTLKPDQIFGGKCVEWNDRNNMQEWRALWADTTNASYERYGHDVRIDHRSYKEQNNGKIPLIRLSREQWEMEKRGIPTPQGERNREIRALNQYNAEKQALYQQKIAEWQALSQVVLLQAALKTESMRQEMVEAPQQEQAREDVKQKKTSPQKTSGSNMRD